MSLAANEVRGQRQAGNGAQEGRRGVYPTSRQGLLRGMDVAAVHEASDR